jgi:hypothetical protein
VLILLCGTTNAQSWQFAPVGAVWHHDATSSVYRASSVKDTLIDGQTCRKIIQKALPDTAYAKYGLFLLDHETMYVYNNEDTVFLYNRSVNRFTPLYVFNVSAGDTVTLPVTFAQCIYFIDTTNSSFRYVVDSVLVKSYDGESFQTVFGRMLQAKRRSVGWQSWSDTAFAYAKVLGTITTGLTPFCRGCAYTADMSCGFTSGLRCYSSDLYNIKLRPGDCDRGFSVSITEYAGKEQAITLAPNPGLDVLRMEGLPAEECTVTIYNGIGQEVYRNSGKHATLLITVSNWPSGIYFCSVADGRGIIYKGQWSKH